MQPGIDLQQFLPPGRPLQDNTILGLSHAAQSITIWEISSSGDLGNCKFERVHSALPIVYTKSLKTKYTNHQFHERQVSSETSISSKGNISVRTKSPYRK